MRLLPVVCVLLLGLVFHSQAKHCKRKVDIVFAMDSSGSMGTRDYLRQKLFIQHLARKFHVSRHGTHVGLIVYSSKAVAPITLRRHYEWRNFARHVSRVPFYRGNTRIDLALKKARLIFMRRYGGRTGVPRILVILTDGQQSAVGGEMPDLGQLVSPLRRMKVKVYAVGIGRHHNPRELRLLVEKQEDVLRARSFNALRDHVYRITSKLCSDAIPPAFGIYPFNAFTRGRDISLNLAPRASFSYISQTTGPLGKYGGALYLRGNRHSYIEIANHNDGKLDTRYAISIFVWVRLSYRGGPIVNYRRNGYGVGLYYYGRGTILANFIGRMGYFRRRLTYRGVRPGKWYYLGMTYDQDTGYGSLWIDGKRVKRIIVGRIVLGTQYPIRIGSVMGMRRSFQGRITCLQIYGAALAADQINAVKQRCSQPQRPLDPCRNRPCQNGGSCIQTTRYRSGFRCRCRTGYYGRFCQNSDGRPTMRPTGRPSPGSPPFGRPPGRPTRTTTPAPTQPPGVPGVPVQRPATIEDIVEYINVFRRLHGSPPVILSEEITLVAKDWALKISKLGTDKTDPNSPYGVTMYLGRGSRNTLAFDCVTEWYETVKYYDWHRRSISIKSKDFVQMIWKSSLYVGVAIVRGLKGRFFVVVYYDVPGNNKNIMDENVPGYTDVQLMVYGAPCPNGFLEYQGSCYKYHTEEVTWDEAFKRSVAQNATLTSIRNIYEIDFLTMAPITDKKSPVWIGLNDRATEGDYTYIDGSPVDFVDWTAGRPQGVGNDCVAVSTKPSYYRFGTMTDLKCTEKHQFISKRPLDGIVTYRILIDIDSMWVDELAYSGTLAYLQLKSKIDEVLLDSFKEDTTMIGANVEYFSPTKEKRPKRSSPTNSSPTNISPTNRPSSTSGSTTPTKKARPKITVSIITKFGQGSKPDPTIPLQKALKKNKGKLPAPVNEKAKIKKIAIVTPGQDSSNMGWCNPYCKYQCMSSCNPTCCSQNIANNAMNPMMGSPMMQRQMGMMQNGITPANQGMMKNKQPCVPTPMNPCLPYQQNMQMPMQNPMIQRQMGVQMPMQPNPYMQQNPFLRRLQMLRQKQLMQKQGCMPGYPCPPIMPQQQMGSPYGMHFPMSPPCIPTPQKPCTKKGGSRSVMPAPEPMISLDTLANQNLYQRPMYPQMPPQKQSKRAMKQQLLSMFAPSNPFPMFVNYNDLPKLLNKIDNPLQHSAIMAYLHPELNQNYPPILGNKKGRTGKGKKGKNKVLEFTAPPLPPIHIFNVPPPFPPMMGGPCGPPPMNPCRPPIPGPIGMRPPMPFGGPMPCGPPPMNPCRPPMPGPMGMRPPMPMGMQPAMPFGGPMPNPMMNMMGQPCMPNPMNQCLPNKKSKKGKKNQKPFMPSPFQHPMMGMPMGMGAPMPFGAPMPCGTPPMNPCRPPMPGPMGMRPPMPMGMPPPMGAPMPFGEPMPCGPPPMNPCRPPMPGPMGMRPPMPMGMPPPMGNPMPFGRPMPCGPPPMNPCRPPMPGPMGMGSPMPMGMQPPMPFGGPMQNPMMNMMGQPCMPMNLCPPTKKGKKGKKGKKPLKPYMHMPSPFQHPMMGQMGMPMGMGGPMQPPMPFGSQMPCGPPPMMNPCRPPMQGGQMPFGAPLPRPNPLLGQPIRPMPFGAPMPMGGPMSCGPPPMNPCRPPMPGPIGMRPPMPFGGPMQPPFGGQMPNPMMQMGMPSPMGFPHPMGFPSCIPTPQKPCTKRGSSRSVMPAPEPLINLDYLGMGMRPPMPFGGPMPNPMMNMMGQPCMPNPMNQCLPNKKGKKGKKNQKPFMPSPFQHPMMGMPMGMGAPMPFGGPMPCGPPPMNPCRPPMPGPMGMRPPMPMGMPPPMGNPMPFGRPMPCGPPPMNPCRPPMPGPMGMRPPMPMGMQPPMPGPMGMQPPMPGPMGMQPPMPGPLGMRPPMPMGMQPPMPFGGPMQNPMMNMMGQPCMPMNLCPPTKKGKKGKKGKKPLKPYMHMPSPFQHPMMGQMGMPMGMGGPMQPPMPFGSQMPCGPPPMMNPCRPPMQGGQMPFGAPLPRPNPLLGQPIRPMPFGAPMPMGGPMPCGPPPMNPCRPPMSGPIGMRPPMPFGGPMQPPFGGQMPNPMIQMGMPSPMGFPHPMGFPSCIPTPQKPCTKRGSSRSVMPAPEPLINLDYLGMGMRPRMPFGGPMPNPMMNMMGQPCMPNAMNQCLPNTKGKKGKKNQKPFMPSPFQHPMMGMPMGMGGQMPFGGPMPCGPPPMNPCRPPMPGPMGMRPPMPMGMQPPMPFGGPMQNPMTNMMGQPCIPMNLCPPTKKGKKGKKEKKTLKPYMHMPSPMLHPMMGQMGMQMPFGGPMPCGPSPMNPCRPPMPGLMGMQPHMGPPMPFGPMPMMGQPCMPSPMNACVPTKKGKMAKNRRPSPFQPPMMGQMGMPMPFGGQPQMPFGGPMPCGPPPMNPCRPPMPGPMGMRPPMPMGMQPPMGNPMPFGGQMLCGPPPMNPCRPPMPGPMGMRPPMPMGMPPPMGNPMPFARPMPCGPPPMNPCRPPMPGAMGMRPGLPFGAQVPFGGQMPMGMGACGPPPMNPCMPGMSMIPQKQNKKGKKKGISKSKKNNPLLHPYHPMAPSPLNPCIPNLFVGCQPVGKPQLVSVSPPLPLGHPLVKMHMNMPLPPMPPPIFKPMSKKELAKQRKMQMRPGMQMPMGGMPMSMGGPCGPPPMNPCMPQMPMTGPMPFRPPMPMPNPLLGQPIRPMGMPMGFGGPMGMGACGLPPLNPCRPMTAQANRRSAKNKKKASKKKSSKAKAKKRPVHNPLLHPYHPMAPSPFNPCIPNLFVGCQPIGKPQLVSVSPPLPLGHPLVKMHMNMPLPPMPPPIFKPMSKKEMAKQRKMQMRPGMQMPIGGMPMGAMPMGMGAPCGPPPMNPCMPQMPMRSPMPMGGQMPMSAPMPFGMGSPMPGGPMQMGMGGPCGPPPMNPCKPQPPLPRPNPLLGQPIRPMPFGAPMTMGGPMPCGPPPMNPCRPPMPFGAPMLGQPMRPPMPFGMPPPMGNPMPFGRPMPCGPPPMNPCRPPMPGPMGMRPPMPMGMPPPMGNPMPFGRPMPCGPPPMNPCRPPMPGPMGMRPPMPMGMPPPMGNPMPFGRPMPCGPPPMNPCRPPMPGPMGMRPPMPMGMQPPMPGPMGMQPPMPGPLGMRPPMPMGMQSPMPFGGPVPNPMMSMMGQPCIPSPMNPCRPTKKGKMGKKPNAPSMPSPFQHPMMGPMGMGAPMPFGAPMQFGQPMGGPMSCGPPPMNPCRPPMGGSMPFGAPLPRPNPLLGQPIKPMPFGAPMPMSAPIPMQPPMHMGQPPMVFGPMPMMTPMGMPYGKPNKKSNKKKKGSKKESAKDKKKAFQLSPYHPMAPSAMNPCVPNIFSACPPVGKPKMISTSPLLPYGHPFAHSPLVQMPVPQKSGFRHPFAGLHPVTPAPKSRNPFVVNLPNIILRYPVKPNPRAAVKKPRMHRPYGMPMQHQMPFGMPMQHPMQFGMQQPMGMLHPQPFNRQPMPSYNNPKNCALPCLKSSGFCPSYCPKFCCMIGQQRIFKKKRNNVPKPNLKHHLKILKHITI